MQRNSVVKIEAGKMFFVFIALFLFLFSPRINLGFGPVIHSGYVSILLLFIATLVLVRRIDVSIFAPIFIISLFFLGLSVYHVLLAFLYENSFIYFLSICVSAVGSIGFGWLLAYFLYSKGVGLCEVVDVIIMVCSLAIFVNSAIIIAEFLSPLVKAALESILYTPAGANINYATHPFRIRGIASSGGASLSVINAVGVLLYLYLVSDKKISGVVALFCCFVIVLSNVFTGRTGLVFSLVFCIAVFLVLTVNVARSFSAGSVRSNIMHIPIFILFLLVSLYLITVDYSAPVFNWAFEWLHSLQRGQFQTASTSDLYSMLFLPDNLRHLLFGIGFFEGEGLLYPRTDSGYLKTILSIGLILSVVLYSSIIYLLFHVVRVSSRYRWLIISIVCMLLITEIKQPFFYQNFTGRFVFLFIGAALFVLGKKRSC